MVYRMEELFCGLGGLAWGALNAGIVGEQKSFDGSCGALYTYRFEVLCKFQLQWFLAYQFTTKFST